jgi:hypothetical protein
MGAANRAQVRPSTAIIPLARLLTCQNVGYQAPCALVCSVRIEGVRGSNPLSSTQVRGRFRSRDRPFLILRQQQTAATIR